MGSFSWLKADTLTEVANIVSDKPFKFLIPAKFGGGYIKEKYQDYGDLGTNDKGNPKYDMYELLAFWNADMKMKDGTLVREHLKYDGEFPLMKECDKYTSDNRSIGIDIGCYDAEIAKLEYPLKLVSASYDGTYEECEGRSFGDPKQGFGPLYRKELGCPRFPKPSKSKREILIEDIATVQCKYKDLCDSDKLTKNALCELCIPFRDKYHLTDWQTLCIVRGDASADDIIDILRSNGNDMI